MGCEVGVSFRLLHQSAYLTPSLRGEVNKPLNLRSQLAARIMAV